MPQVLTKKSRVLTIQKIKKKTNLKTSPSGFCPLTFCRSITAKIAKPHDLGFCFIHPYILQL